MKLLEIIQHAEKGKVAIGHFNVANLEQLKAVAHAGMRLNAPVIVGVSEGEGEYLGLHHFRDLVASYNAEHARPHGFRLYLNADHVHSLEHAREAARAGFHAVLFDPLGGARSKGKTLSFESHIAQTRMAVRLVKSIDPAILVEGELGYIGGSSEVLEAVPKGAAVRPEELTKPEDAARFVKETGVDLLAPAVGNIHGMLKGTGNPPLDIPRIRAIRMAARVPLVLHGGSGISDSDFLEAIDAGISVIHISTELRVAWRVGLEHSLKTHPQEVAPYKLMPEALAAMENVVERRLKLFGKI
ncbi:MAG: class II fructose-bisphosphate aldolase [Candidatus Jorgensenbacteria bacterium]